MGKTDVTILDIANRANVSKSTVSRVLNNSTRVNEEKRSAVLAAMDELGFQPNIFARSLAGGRSMTIGIVTQNIGSPFYDAIAQGIIQAFSGTGYSPIFADGQWQQNTEQEAIKSLLGRRVDGMLLMGGKLPTEELNSLRDRVPTILVGRKVEGWTSQQICVDNVEAGRIATQHLIERGHRRIAILRGLPDHQDAIDRFAGYSQAHEEADIEFNEDLVFEGDFSAQSGVMGINTLLSRGAHFTALFAANDMVAFGARLALHRHGVRVPEDVSLIGFDDQAEAAFMTPPLTTMAQPAVEMGRESANALIRLMNGEAPMLPTMSAVLKVRETVAKVR